MCDEVLVVLRGKADTLDVFSGDMTDCIPAEVPSLLKTHFRSVIETFQT